MAEKKTSVIESIMLSILILGFMGTAITGWIGASWSIDKDDGEGLGMCLAASALALWAMAWTMISLERREDGGK